MNAIRFSLLLAFSAAIFIGCDDKKEDPKPDPNKVVVPPTTKVTPTTKPAIDLPKIGGGLEVPKVPDAAAAIKANGTDWIAKLEDAVKANKLDEAKTYLDKLDGIKASLPEDLQTKLTSVKALYDAAKAKGAVTLPKLPGVGDNK